MSLSGGRASERNLESLRWEDDVNTTQGLKMRNIGLKASVLLLGAAALGFSATQASARIVCNQEGDCWHVRSDYDYKPGLHLTIHPDDWRFHGDHYRWREHEGRGYWHGNTWMTF